MTCQCYWCGEVRHRSDMRVVDDKLMCREDLTDCIDEYKESTNPGINVDRAQIRALGTTAY